MCLLSRRMFVSKPKLILISRDEALLTTQQAVLKQRGYPTRALPDDDWQKVLDHDFDIAVINHTVNRRRREQIVNAIKRFDPRRLVLVLHASASQNPEVDAAMDSRLGPAAMLQVVDQLAVMKAVQEHNHPELKNKIVAVVDKERHYTFVSDGVCELLGWSRAELIGQRIEDISPEKTPAEVEAQFRRFLKQGSMEGEFTLRHREGHAVRVAYVARVLPDGCLMAIWEPVQEGLGKKAHA